MQYLPNITFNLSKVSSVCIHDLNFVITVPVDVLAPNGARPSAGTVLITKSDMSSSRFLWLLIIYNASERSNAVCRNGWGDLWNKWLMSDHPKLALVFVRHAPSSNCHWCWWDSPQHKTDGLHWGAIRLLLLLEFRMELVNPKCHLDKWYGHDALWLQKHCIISILLGAKQSHYINFSKILTMDTA